MFWAPDDSYAPQGAVSLAIQSGRFRLPPEGLFGGKPGAKAQFLVNGQPGNPYGLTRLRAGDTVVMDAAGGGATVTRGKGIPMRSSAISPMAGGTRPSRRRKERWMETIDNSSDSGIDAPAARHLIRLIRAATLQVSHL